MDSINDKNNLADFYMYVDNISCLTFDLKKQNKKTIVLAVKVIGIARMVILY